MVSHVMRSDRKGILRNALEMNIRRTRALGRYSHDEEIQ